MILCEPLSRTHSRDHSPRS